MAPNSKNPQADDRQTPVSVVFSYVPLLVGEARFVRSDDDPEFAGVRRWLEASHDGQVEGCLWVLEGEKAVPVFILEQAHAVADHLVAWAEGKPEGWFRLCFAEQQGRYAAVLFPNLEGSVRRSKLAYLIQFEEVMPTERVQVIYVPLQFVSGPRHMFGDVRSRIPAKAMLGFVDADDVNRGNPLGTDPDKIKMVGPFEVCWDCKPFGMDISGSVAEQITSATKPRKRRRRR